jgi:2-dehydropantoate 2-reductase
VRYIVYGAGAIGGLAGGRMAQGGAEVVLIARGAHAEAMASDGLTIVSAEGTTTVKVPVVTDPSEVDFGADDVVLLAMKSHQTGAALDALRRVAPLSTPIVCLQNGVENERAALRLYANVYGVCVMCPASHLEAGVVQQDSVPVPGLLDVGRYPGGLDATVTEIAEAFRIAGFDSIERPDVMRWKYRKLIMNLGNAANAVIAPPGSMAVAKRAQEEGEACFQAAGIEHASVVEDRHRRADIMQIRDIPGRPRGGGSSWQSLRRGSGSIESDYLSGEVSLLGRLHGVVTPVNDLLGQLAWEAALRGAEPGAMTVEEFEAHLTAGGAEGAGRVLRPPADTP